MSQAIKIAVSLPLSQYKQIESIRLKKGMTRSGLIFRAIEHWLHCGEEKERIRQYIKGYQEIPETSRQWKSFEKAQAAHLLSEDWS